MSRNKNRVAKLKKFIIWFVFWSIIISLVAIVVQEIQIIKLQKQIDVLTMMFATSGAIISQ